MTSKRFVTFVNRMEAIQKYLRRIRALLGSEMDMKGVHVLWVYLLSMHPDGLTSAEIAEVSSVDRSLVSREIRMLQENGIVELEETNGRRTYNSTVRLTEKGRKYAAEIEIKALQIQNFVDTDISEEELNYFYSATEKICHNFGVILEGETNES